MDAARGFKHGGLAVRAVNRQSLLEDELLISCRVHNNDAKSFLYFTIRRHAWGGQIIATYTTRVIGASMQLQVLVRDQRRTGFAPRHSTSVIDELLRIEFSIAFVASTCTSSSDITNLTFTRISHLGCRCGNIYFCPCIPEELLKRHLINFLKSMSHNTDPVSGNEKCDAILFGGYISLLK